jgi:hypothetical protein
MPRLVTTALRLIWVLAGVAMVSCAQSPTVPSDIGTVDQLVQALRREGLTVSQGGEISAKTMGFFTVPARQILVGAERLNAFDYPTADRAAADAALISSDAQPNPRAAISWVSRPHFYRQLRVIALYVGCSAEITEALERLLGPPVATGPTPCR